ncbi:hypothetical protein BGZ99_003007 [Dissophora globulifera]|uniref:Uncharacterized protein n=1 Tax=Dissophora globulifera TaxID=979702 RepID=A0A9P6RP28_9FUNG|nr:hypothetical protein BGZ99_003007 [Dissophora globulifera]
MLVNALGARLSLAEVTMHCSVESVWTIDLAYLLRKLSNDQVNVPHLQQMPLLIPSLSPGRDGSWDFTYYTSTIGANTAHSKERFYKLSFDDDQKRVDALFENADAANIRVIEIQDNMADESKLYSSSLLLRREIGHFIVLVAYDPTEDIFYYRDPAVLDDLCSISARDLERARSSSGTDHDCIVVKVT